MNFDEEFEIGKIIDRVSNGEISEYYVIRGNEVYCSNGDFICNADDEDMQDKIYEHKENWREVNWNTRDWMDYSGSQNESELDEFMEGFLFN